MKYFISLILLIALFSCNSESPNDTHAAYWIENTSDSLTKIHVLSFNKQKKGYKGTLYILEKNKKESSFEMKDVKINDKIVKFSVPELNISFKGEISDNLFNLTGEFTTKNNTKVKYTAEKTMDEHYDKFKEDLLKIE